MNKKLAQGFTLIEVMIVVAIIGIITSIAIPSYSEYVKRGKRVDAKVELLQIAQLQESYFVQNLSYAKDLTTSSGGLGLGAVVESEQEHYLITMVASGSGSCDGTASNSCSSYTLTATPQGSQNSDKCKNFTLTNTGVKDVVGAAAGYDRKKCWK